MTDNIEQPITLTILKAKRAALDRLISAFEEASAVGALGQPGDLPTPAAGSIAGNVGRPMELPVGAFRGKSLPEAIKLYLAASKKKQSIREIATALKEGGMESLAANFETVVTGSLNRLKASGAVLRFKDGWDLAEHHHPSLVNRLSQEQKPKEKKAKGRKKKVAGKRTRGSRVPCPQNRP